MVTSGHLATDHFKIVGFLDTYLPNLQADIRASDNQRVIPVNYITGAYDLADTFGFVPPPVSKTIKKFRKGYNIYSKMARGKTKKRYRSTSTKSRSKSKRKYSKKYKGQVKVKPNGDSTGTKKKNSTKSKANRKMSQSMIQRIKKLEKLLRDKLPKHSTYVQKKVRQYKITNTFPHRKTCYVIKGIQSTEIETMITDAGLTLVENSTYRLSGLKMNVVIKNNSSQNCKLKGCWYVANDDFVTLTGGDAGKEISKMLKDLWTDRTVPAGNIGAESAPGTTNHRIPEYLEHTMGLFNYSFDPASPPGLNQYLKKITKAYAYTLGPGDSINFAAYVPKLVYKPEVLDRKSSTYLKGKDFIFLLSAVGDVISNGNLVSTGEIGLDAMYFQSMACHIDDGLGLLKMAEKSTDYDVLQTNLDSSGEGRTSGYIAKTQQVIQRT